MTGHKEFVVGVDGSEAGSRALRWALHEARARGASVAAVMVWQRHAVLGGPAPLTMNPRLAPHHVREQHRQELMRVVDECAAGEHLPELQVELREGRPAEALTERSASALMLVLGNRGHGRIAEAVLGSTALRCIHSARCPVLIIPGGVDVGGTSADTGNRAVDPVLG
ncbi:universal stress protein [Saccharopolyspora tripterygii]